MRAQQRLTQRIHKLAHRKAKKICNAAADPSRADTQTTVNCREQAWLLKKSVFLKKVENRVIENAQGTGKNRL